jgi:hypothetical protein
VVCGGKHLVVRTLKFNMIFFLSSFFSIWFYICLICKQLLFISIKLILDKIAQITSNIYTHWLPWQIAITLRVQCPLKLSQYYDLISHLATFMLNWENILCNVKTNCPLWTS